MIYFSCTEWLKAEGKFPSSFHATIAAAAAAPAAADGDHRKAQMAFEARFPFYRVSEAQPCLALPTL